MGDWNNPEFIKLFDKLNKDSREELDTKELPPEVAEINQNIAIATCIFLDFKGFDYNGRVLANSLEQRIKILEIDICKK